MDFTNCARKNKFYSGANGNKIAILLNDEQYMLKFPSIAKTNDNLSYANSTISEYLGSHIFGMLGISAQETILGEYTLNDKKKICVACKDFTSENVILQDFASLKNTVIDSNTNGYGTELTDVIQTIEMQDYIESDKLKRFFWDIFIADALIGNFDRHNGNWGFLYNTKTDEIEIAPVYDCGSSLFPQADQKIMEEVLTSSSALDARIFVFPLSCYKEEGKINYFDFISSLKNEDCNAALKRITPRIDINEIDDLIDNTPYINQLQKDFYKLILRSRKEKILDYSLNQLILKENKTKIR